jgi:hypothetical protein
MLGRIASTLAAPRLDRPAAAAIVVSGDLVMFQAEHVGFCKDVTCSSHILFIVRSFDIGDCLGPRNTNVLGTKPRYQNHPSNSASLSGFTHFPPSGPDTQCSS